MSGAGFLRRALIVPALAWLLAAGPQAPARLPADRVDVWASSADGARRLAHLEPVAVHRAQAGAGDDLIVDPGRPAQAIVGYGAAMTDASAELFQQVLTRPERNALFAELFGRDGLRLNFLRVPIGASDFSSRHYSFDDMPAGQRDENLAHFSIAPAKAAQIPALRAARRVNPGLVLMASPWSPPGWMKTTDSLIRGRPLPAAYPALAGYFVRYLDAMRREGLPVGYLSVQNEPAFEPANYPGMLFPAAERARFIGQHLGPALARRRSGVRILDWDHNWDRPEEPLAVLGDPVAARYVSGVAWHCYAGDPAAMEAVRRAHPDKDTFFTECSGGEWDPGWRALGWMVDNLLIAPSRAGSRGTILWNLALDENSGPHLGGCGNCRGVVTIERGSHKVTRNVEYYVLGHVSRFVRPGARAVASTGGPAGVSHAAFRNPDGTLVLLLHNGGASAAAVTVRSGSGAFTVPAPAGEVMTAVWR